MDSIANALSRLSEIEYSQGPVPAYLTLSPNDPYYQNNNYRWSFDVINAEQAWDITEGSQSIIVSMNDQFGSLGTIHEDLTGKVVYRYNSSASRGHGTETAGVVGALTDNNLDIASLGWNTSVMFNDWSNPVNEVYTAINNGADVINFSWVSFGYTQDMASAIHTALQEGVVCIASAGNNESPNPGVRYPAAYNFGSDGQVIAVSGTELDNGTEQFITNYNYSPGTDPINDPTNAFIDCSAPGTNYRALSETVTTGTIHIFAGTSISTPFVSALVSLMLSINDSLTPTQIYEIITQSAEKIGNHTYNGNGWNQYLGYGRINAYQALKYTLEHYGGTITQSFTIPSGEMWDFQPGVTVKFASNTSLTVNGTLNVNGTSSNPVTFDFSGNYLAKGIQINPDGHFDISYAVIDGPGIGMYVNEGWGTIDNTEFNNHFTDLHLYRTNYSTGDVYLTDNTFNAAEEGLILEHSSPKLGGNKFSGNQYGIQASNYSSAQLGYVNQEGRNVFDYCQWGSITGYNNCDLFLGKADCITNGGYNSFRYIPIPYIHIDVSNYCQVIAEKNWWGSNPPTSGSFISDGTSSIDYTPYLTSDPNPLAKIAVGKSPEEAEFDNAFVSASVITSNSMADGVKSKVAQLNGGAKSLYSYFDQSWSLKRKLRFTRRLLDISSSSIDYTQEVKTICKDIIRDNKDSSLSFWALDILWKAYKESAQQTEFKQYLDMLTSDQESYTGAASVFLASAELIAYGFDYENELMNLNNFIGKHKGDATIEYALYQKFMHQKNERKIQDAKITAEELGRLFPESRGYKFAMRSFEHSKKSVNKEIKVTSTVLPKEYSLLGNYPNPFNPSTKIRYVLRFNSDVEITIYNINGQIVKAFKYGSQSAGVYNVKWDGTNINNEHVASGIYLYHFKAVSLKENTVFEKSAKLILMK